MVNQVPIGSYNKNIFSDFALRPGGQTFMNTAAQTSSTVSNTESKKNRTKTLAFAVGSSALLAGVGVLVLMRGLPKNTGNFLEKIKSFLEKRHEKNSLKGSDRWNEFYIYSIRKINSFIDKSQSINNFASLKDILFKNLMVRSKFTTKIHSGISNFFEKISRKTVTSSYKNTGRKFEQMYTAFDNLDNAILKNNPNETFTYNGQIYTKRQLVAMARAKRIGVKHSVNAFMSESQLKDRYKYIKKITSNLYNQFWDESFKDFWSKKNKFRRKEMWQTFIPETKIAKGKRSLADDVAAVRNKISYTDKDKINIINKHITLLEDLVAPSDKDGFDIIKKLKWFLKNPEGVNSNNEVFLKELAKLRERPFEKGLNETVINNQAKLRETYIKSINDLLTKNKSGELQEMLEIYEKIAPYEVSLIKPKVTKAVASFDKSLNLETVEFFDKVRDLELGSAPTDVLSILASGGMIAYGLTKAKDADEKWSVTLKAGIPIVGAIGTSLFCTARLISGGKSLLFGAISGLVIGKVGQIADNLRKKYSKNTPKSQVA